MQVWSRRPSAAIRLPGNDIQQSRGKRGNYAGRRNGSAHTNTSQRLWACRNDFKYPRILIVEGWYELTADSHFWFQWRLTALLGQLMRLGIPLTEPFKVLEVGGGTGVLRSQLERSTQWCVDMIDLDLSALAHAKPGCSRIMYYDICEEREPFVEAYDIVVLLDVLHIPHTQPFLSSVIRHIKPNGFLLINVPASTNPLQ